jgi:spore coat protein CotH
MGQAETADIFFDLPEALIDELLSQCGTVSESLSRSFVTLNQEKENIREQLRKKDLLH